MHELGIVQNMLDLVIKEAQKQGATRIAAIHIMRGEESDVSPESFEFYFGLLRPGTLAAGAKLSFGSQSHSRALYVESLEVE